MSARKSMGNPNRLVLRLPSFLALLFLLPCVAMGQSASVSGDLSSTRLDTSALEDKETTVALSQEDNDHARSLPLVEPAETVLAPYKEKGTGGFSQRWAVYVTSQGEEKAKRWFIELNGRKLGPFENTSDLMSFSRNGEKVVFAALENKAAGWGIYVNGEKKWSHAGLGWRSYTWPLNLEGTSILNQSQAVSFTQSDDGQFVAYSVSGSGDKWAEACDGKVGPFYDSTGNDRVFVNGSLVYTGTRDKRQYVVAGNKEQGPYDKAYGLYASSDGKHMGYIATSGDKAMLVVDGKEVSVPGKIVTAEFDQIGGYAVAYNQQGSVKVSHNGTLWPNTYAECLWHQFCLTPDGKNLAGWFRRGNQWFVVVNGTVEYGPYDSYYFFEAGKYYGLFLGRNGKSVAYYAKGRGGDATFFLNGKNAEDRAPSFGGIAMTVYTDDNGNTVGTGMMGGIEADTAAVADAVDAGSSEPLTARYLGDRLALVETKGGLKSARIASDTYGPFTGVDGFCVSPSGRHFAFIAQNQKGKWIVLDGKAHTPIFTKIYRPAFVDETEFACLTVKDGNVVRLSFRTAEEKPILAALKKILPSARVTATPVPVPTETPAAVSAAKDEERKPTSTPMTIPVRKPTPSVSKAAASPASPSMNQGLVYLGVMFVAGLLLAVVLAKKGI